MIWRAVIKSPLGPSVFHDLVLGVRAAGSLGAHGFIKNKK